MKFIHTSDWHIGRYFHNISLLDDQAYILKQLLDYLETQQVDALIIAGDIYDRALPPAQAVALLDNTFAQINELGLPILLIPGNHDSKAHLSFCARQLKQADIHIFSELETIQHGVEITGRSGITTTFYGLPYTEPAQAQSIFKQPIANHQELHKILIETILEQACESSKKVLISHSFVRGGNTSESERPLTIGGAEQVSADLFAEFDYVALGHLHEAQHCTYDHIRYSGSPLKYSFSEHQHNKGINCVSLHKDSITINHQPLKPLRDVRVIEGYLNEILEQAKTDPNNEDYLLIKLLDTQAILNIMDKLRAVYPNVLHLEKASLARHSVRQAERRKNIKHNEVALFNDFYQQVAGQTISGPEQAAIEKVLTQIYNEKN